MTDNFRQIGKHLYKNRRDSDYAAKRLGNKGPVVERVSDIFDDKISFTMEFRTKSRKDITTLNLIFRGPPPTSCCAGCYCAVCERFSDVTELDLTYGYLPGTVNVTIDGVISEDFSETDPAGGIVTLGSTGENIRICYVYELGECV